MVSLPPKSMKRSMRGLSTFHFTTTSKLKLVQWSLSYGHYMSTSATLQSHSTTSQRYHYISTILLIYYYSSTKIVIGQSTKCPSTCCHFLQTTPFGFWWHRGRKETPLRLNLYNFTTLWLLKNGPSTKTIMGQSKKCSPSTCCHSQVFLSKAGSYPAMIHYSNIQIDLCFSE